MSERGPDGPHVFQPFGCQDARWECGRIYGVGGVNILATIQGLTKDEAEAVCAALRQLAELGPEKRTCASCGRRWTEDTVWCPECKKHD